MLKNLVALASAVIVLSTGCGGNPEDLAGSDENTVGNSAHQTVSFDTFFVRNQAVESSQCTVSGKSVPQALYNCHDLNHSLKCGFPGSEEPVLLSKRIVNRCYTILQGEESSDSSSGGAPSAVAERTDRRSNEQEQEPIENPDDLSPVSYERTWSLSHAPQIVKDCARGRCARFLEVSGNEVTLDACIGLTRWSDGQNREEVSIYGDFQCAITSGRRYAKREQPGETVLSLH